MDDDDFLYGDSKAEPEPTVLTASVPQPISAEKTYASNGVVSHLEVEAEDDTVDLGEEDETETQDDGVIDGEESDDDVEIILEPTARSLDFRQNQPPRPPGLRTTSAVTSTPVKAPQPSLTTEYTPHERGGLTSAPKTSIVPQPIPAPSFAGAAQPGPIPVDEQGRTDSGPDPSTLPPATAPPSHPAINIDLPGTFDGRSILDVDLNAMSEKPWRRPGSDLSDWFNYGFDEISWEAYCYRRRDLGDMAATLKANVLNFAGMPEDQLSALPIEVRQMVMTGATAMMSGGGPNPGMMGPGVGINPMMDMSGMNAMNMMGMNGDMGMQMQPGGPMMQEGPGPVQGSGATPEQGVHMGIQDGFGPGGPGPGMMGMGMGGDFGMQDPNQMGQQIYPGMVEGSGTPNPAVGRGAGPASYRGRSMPLRGRGRGRGRGGGMYAAVGDGERPPIPVRPASPLPPGVPTGPRNQNKYKDRDGNAPAVDGLDYGGTNKDGVRTPSGEPEDKGSNRKRRSSPGLDDARGTKRR